MGPQTWDFKSRIQDPKSKMFKKLLDPWKKSWIQMGLDLRDSQAAEFLEYIKPKNKAWTSHNQTKTLSEQFCFLSFVALSRFCCNAHPHPLRVAAVGSARYCIILNLAGHHPGRCLFFADVIMVLSTLSESYLKPWEKYITDSQDEKIQQVNRFQHRLWSLLSKQSSPII